MRSLESYAEVRRHNADLSNLGLDAIYSIERNLKSD